MSHSFDGKSNLVDGVLRSQTGRRIDTVNAVRRNAMPHVASPAALQQQQAIPVVFGTELFTNPDQNIQHSHAPNVNENNAHKWKSTPNRSTCKCPT